MTGFVLAAGLSATLFCDEARGLGLCLAVLVLDHLETAFRFADDGRTRFGELYGTVLAAVIYAGLYIFLPFFVEWRITPLWPGQTLITFLTALLPCLLKLLPLF